MDIMRVVSMVRYRMVQLQHQRRTGPEQEQNVALRPVNGIGIARI